MHGHRYNCERKLTFWHKKVICMNPVLGTKWTGFRFNGIFYPYPPGNIWNFQGRHPSENCLEFKWSDKWGQAIDSTIKLSTCLGSILIRMIVSETQSPFQIASRDRVSWGVRYRLFWTRQSTAIVGGISGDSSDLDFNGVQFAGWTHLFDASVIVLPGERLPL